MSGPDPIKTISRVKFCYSGLERSDWQEIFERALRKLTGEIFFYRIGPVRTLFRKELPPTSFKQNEKFSSAKKFRKKNCLTFLRKVLKHFCKVISSLRERQRETEREREREFRAQMPIPDQRNRRTKVALKKSVCETNAIWRVCFAKKCS